MSNSSFHHISLFISLTTEQKITAIARAVIEGDYTKSELDSRLYDAAKDKKQFTTLNDVRDSVVSRVNELVYTRLDDLY